MDVSVLYIRYTEANVWKLRFHITRQTAFFRGRQNFSSLLTLHFNFLHIFYTSMYIKCVVHGCACTNLKQNEIPSWLHLASVYITWMSTNCVGVLTTIPSAGDHTCHTCFHLDTTRLCRGLHQCLPLSLWFRGTATNKPTHLLLLVSHQSSQWKTHWQYYFSYSRTLLLNQW